MEYILLSICMILLFTALYILLFKCYPSKKDISKVNQEKIKLVRNRIFV